jgi:hypothetical protein
LIFLWLTEQGWDLFEVNPDTFNLPALLFSNLRRLDFLLSLTRDSPEERVRFPRRRFS